MLMTNSASGSPNEASPEPHVEGMGSLNAAADGKDEGPPVLNRVSRSSISGSILDSSVYPTERSE